MPGKIKKLIDELIYVRSKGNPGLEHFTRANLVLNGIEPEHYTESSEDDPSIISKLEEMIAAFRTD